MEQDIMSSQIIFRPQFHFICNEDKNLIPRHVFKIESPDKIENYLMNRLNKPVQLRNMNKSTRSGIKEVSNSTTSVVRELYRSDYRLFGY